MKIHLSYAILMLALMLCSCISVKPIEVRSVACCDLKRVVKTETEIGFSVDVYNPNDFPITLKRYSLDVLINGGSIGNVREDLATIIPANDGTTYSSGVLISTKKLMANTLLMGLNTLLKKDPAKLDVEVSGYVVGAAKGFSKRVKVRESYPLQLHP